MHLLQYFIFLFSICLSTPQPQTHIKKMSKTWRASGTVQKLWKALQNLVLSELSIFNVHWTQTMLSFSVSLIALLCLDCKVSERNLCLYCSLGEFTHLSGVNSAHTCSTFILCLKCSHLEKVQFTYQPGALVNDRFWKQGTIQFIYFFF